QSSTPAMADGKIIVCTEDGDMHCVNAADGKGLWKVMCTNQRGAGHGIVFCSPLIYDGMVYVGNRIGQVWAVDFKTGEAKWTWQEEGLKPEIFSSPKGGKDGIVLGTVDQKARRGHIVCLDPKSGELKWRCPTSREVGATIALFGGNVYAPCKDRRIYEIEYSTGKLRRRLHLPGTTHCTPTIAMGFAFLVAGGKHSVAVDLITGETRWDHDAPCEDKIAVSFWKGRVFYPLGRYLRAFDAVSGNQLWEFEADHKLTPPCVAADGSVLLTGRDRFFRVIDKFGKEIKKINLGEPCVAGPILVDGVVYVTSDVNVGHHLFALAEME
ncbi:MAG: PQQ-binding-like beta-propeller repeat protein, partial [Planctomycetes bacterium]|nr:PQQ-binding-like beta-propeller repeat protein [Planctomycetota bacterium]